MDLHKADGNTYRGYDKNGNYLEIDASTVDNVKWTAGNEGVGYG